MEITPAFRTRYAAYLQSSDWRTRRNRALKAAFFRCSKCGAKRSVEVHHKSYERLGAEWDDDLQVLCRDCHEGHHVQEMSDHDKHRVYLKLASEVLKGHAFDSFTELVAEVKAQCVKLKLPYDDHQVDRAVQFLTSSNRLAAPPPATRAEVEQEMGRPISKPEAREFLRRVGGLEALIKTMPNAPQKIDIYGPIPREDDYGDHDRY